MSGSHERSDPRKTIELQNVVASTGIKQELDLESVAIDLLGADYNPNNFPGIVYRTEEPRAATLYSVRGRCPRHSSSSPAASAAFPAVSSQSTAWQYRCDWPSSTIGSACSLQASIVHCACSSQTASTTGSTTLEDTPRIVVREGEPLFAHEFVGQRFEDV
jgi:hypothetical protein